MKLFATAFLTLVVISVYAQNQSTLIAVNSTPIAGQENNYSYTPHAGLALPDKLLASVVYFNNGVFNRAVPMVKTGSTYTFSFKAPDSTAALLICIVDSNKTMLDNNQEKTFITYLCYKTGKRVANAKAIVAQLLLGGYPSNTFELTVAKGLVKELYEESFKQHPEIKKDYYTSYLRALYLQNEDSAKPLLLSHAKLLLAKPGTEQQWLDARGLYKLMKRKEEVTKTETKIMAAYPNGSLALDKFWDSVYDDGDVSINKYLDYMHAYIKQFKDSSTNKKDNFYRMIIRYCCGMKDWAGLDKYWAIITDKTRVLDDYDDFAGDLCGKLDSTSTDLAHAAILSQRALQGTKDWMYNPAMREDVRLNGKAAYDGYADTYALILFKLGKVDSAFYYEDGIDKSTFRDGNRELLARCAEKVKGPEYARKYIEAQLLAGSTSVTLQKQLQGIYKQLNLPEDEYDKIKQKAIAVAQQHQLDQIKALLGTRQAKNFTLKDLDGKTVTLASIHNKVVVLDFWATWCGPCRASFPAMQQAVTKYKNDSDVVFLFLDVWELGDEANIYKNTSKFIQDNHYTFHVLVDKDKIVSPLYKVDAIPTKIIINRQGNIVFMGHELSDMSSFIDNAKNG